jgi:transporter family protein
MVGTTSATTYAVGAMLLWGAWGILAKHSLDYMSETTVLLITYLVSIGVIFSIDPGITDRLPSSTGLALAIGTGVTMCLGTVLYYRSVNLGSLSIVPAIPALYFVVTTVYGVTVLDETLSATQMLGIVLACVAIVLLTR